MLLLILTKDLKRASASYLALWATSMVDCVVLSLYWSLALLAWYFDLPAVFSDVGLDFIQRQFLAAALAGRLHIPQQLFLAKMLRQKPNLGCLHIWQFFTPFFTSWSAQCPQTGWPHGLAICGLTIGYLLKWKESMSSVGRNLCPWNNQSKEFYFSYQISQINSFGTLLTSTFSKNCWDDMFGRLSQVYHVRVMI